MITSMPKARRDCFNCDIAFTEERASHAWYAAQPSSGLSSQDGAVITVRAVRSSRARVGRVLRVRVERHFSYSIRLFAQLEQQALKGHGFIDCCISNV